MLDGSYVSELYPQSAVLFTRCRYVTMIPRSKVFVTFVMYSNNTDYDVLRYVKMTDPKVTHFRLYSGKNRLESLCVQ